MATFVEIKTVIKEIVEEYGEFHSLNMNEFSNLTQKTEASTILIVLDAAEIRTTNEFTEGNRVLSNYNLKLYIVKYCSDEFTEDQIDDIYSAMELISQKIAWNLNQGSLKVFNGDIFDTLRVKFVTPNIFAGCVMNIQSLSTACNL